MASPDPRWEKLHALARRQAGAFTDLQARECGITRDELRTMRRRGHLLRRHPRVWVLAGAPRTPGLAEWAALLHLGEPSALSHLSAAAHEGLMPAPARPWLSIPAGRRAPATDGFRVMRTRTFEMVPLADGRRVTPPARTIVDLGRCLPERELAAALLTLLQRGRVTSETVTARLAAVGPSYRGSALVRRVVATFTKEFESILGAEAWELLHPHLDGLVVGHRVVLPDGQVRIFDLAVPDARVDIEIDSWAWHGSKAQQRADRERDRILAAAGYVTVRLTTEDIRRLPAPTVRQVQAVVRAQRRRAA